MDSRNVAVVRRVLAAFEARDREAMFALYDPAIVWDVSRMNIAAALDRAEFVGPEGIAEFWRDYLSAFRDVRFEYGEFVPAGDAVLVTVRQQASGRSSGVPLETREYAMVWTVRDGRATRMDMYPTVADARRAAGLAQ